VTRKNSGKKDEAFWVILNRIATIGGVLGAITAAFVFWDNICGRFPEIARLVPFATCKPATVADPSRATVEEMRTTRAIIEKKLDELSAKDLHRPEPPEPLERAFMATPMWFGATLTTSVQKISTDTGGTLRIFACSRTSRMMHYVGETAYSSGHEKFTFTSSFPEPTAVLLLQIEPAKGNPGSVAASWELATQVRLKAPASRPGVLNCNDIIGKF
jgi:hypothetical protein